MAREGNEIRTGSV